MARIRSHLTYANVMATIAVFLVLGGSGFAALNHKDKRKVRRIADQEIAVQAPGLSVASAANAANATNAVNAANAVNAEHAGSADSAGSADKADSATNSNHASNADSAANADKLDGLDSTDIGLGFLTGRVDNLALTGSTGNAPSGVTAATSTAVLADQDMTLSPNRSIVMRSFRVSLSTGMGCSGICGSGEVGVAHLEAFAPGSGSVTTALSCNILTNTVGCSASGPSGTVPAGSSLRVSFTRTGDAQYNAGTDALFSWQATAG